MANVKPLERSEAAELEGFFKVAEAGMGFLPNSLLTMSHIRQLTPIFSIFVATVRGADAKELLAALGDQIPDQIPPSLYHVSLEGGCYFFRLAHYLLFLSYGPSNSM